MMGKNARKVEFKTHDDTTLRGVLSIPESYNAPVIVMSAGLTFLKEHFIDAFAEQFASSGFATLIYDHRSWGSSDGIPRSESNFFQQAEDYSDAITFVSTLKPEIDPSRICIWGAGHSGGLVMQVGATDARVKVVVTMVPFISGEADAKYFPTGFLEQAWQERIAGIGKPKSNPKYIPIFAESREAAIAHPTERLIGNEDAFGFYEAVKARSDAAGTPWENKITLQCLYFMSKYEPATYIHRIAPKPLLYVVAKGDMFIPFERQKKAFDVAGEPKELVILDSAHLDTYSGGIFEQNVKKQIEFLQHNL